MKWGGDTLKLSICTFIWLNYPLEEAIKRIKWIGYQGVEIYGGRPHAYPPDMSSTTIKKLRDTIIANDLEIACFTPEQCRYPVNIASPYDVERKDSINFLKKSIECAAEFGAPVMDINPGRAYFGQPKKKAWELSVEALRECAAYAEKFGIKLALEPLTRLESNIVVTLDDLLAMLDEVNAPNLGCLLDTGHVNVTHENMVDYKVLGERLYHIHISDNNGLVDQHLIPGRGTVKFEALLKMLKELNYKGFLSAELGFMYTLDPDNAAIETKNFMDSLFHV